MAGFKIQGGSRGESDSLTQLTEITRRTPAKSISTGAAPGGAPRRIADPPVAGKSERTRRALIYTAERLFGELGIDAVGLRAIAEAANQKNSNAVQYHFGDKLELLKAIFELREGQLQPERQALLDQGEAQGRLGDVRWLLRVCFEPNFKLYRDRHEISYLKLHATYLTTHRPRGVPHPVDYDSPNSVAFRRAIRLLGKRLAFLGERRLWFRLEGVGEMFLSALIQHAARKEELNLPVDELFEDTIEMMAAAIVAPPSR
jgi:AcrR family transcriptional regulator